MAFQAEASPLVRTLRRILRTVEAAPRSHVPRLEGVQESTSTLLGWLSWARLALRGPLFGTRLLPEAARVLGLSYRNVQGLGLLGWEWTVRDMSPPSGGA